MDSAPGRGRHLPGLPAGEPHEDPGHRGRPHRRPVREARAGGAALPGRPGGRRHGGAAARLGRPVRSGRARSPPAGHERPRGAAHPARPRHHDADPGAHRAGRGGLQGPGAPRRAPTTTSPSRSPSRSCWRGSRRWAAGPRRSATRCSGCGDLELDTATREVRRGGRADRPHAQGVHRARVPDAARGPGDVPHADHRVRLGLSLRPRHQHRGRGDQPAAQEGGLRATRRSWCTPCAASGTS